MTTLDLDKVTAARLGPAWMTKYGCPAECAFDHAGPDGEPGWHSTYPVETVMRDIGDQYSARENAQTPFLAAQAVVHDFRQQAYGRRTEMWLHYGRSTGTVTPAKAREVAREIREFAARLEALCDQADQIAADDFEGDPEIARLDREAEDRRIRAITEGRV